MSDVLAVTEAGSVDVHTGEIAVRHNDQGLPVGYTGHTLSEDTWSNRVAVAKAINDAVATDEFFEKPFSVTAVVTQVVEMENEQRPGQLDVVTRTTLITSLGALVTSSTTIAREVSQYQAILGPIETWDAKLQFKITEKKSKKSATNRFQTMSIV